MAFKDWDLPRYQPDTSWISSLILIVKSPWQEWSNRGARILGSTIPIYVLSIVVISWRVVYGVRTRRKLFLGDYLLIAAAVGPQLIECIPN